LLGVSAVKMVEQQPELEAMDQQRVDMSATAVDVKERPVLFGAPMVRTILSGQKTLARCAVTKRLDPDMEFAYEDGAGNWIFWGGAVASDMAAFTKKAYPNGEGIACPYGKRGERLWVREALRWTDWLVYDADQTQVDPDLIPSNVRIGKDYLFAQLMPRWASRIALEITNVRVEKLQDMSCEDVWAEGSPIPLREHSNPELGIQCVSAKEWFAEEWDKLNAKHGYSWASNPWVFVIEFRKP